LGILGVPIVVRVFYFFHVFDLNLYSGKSVGHHIVDAAPKCREDETYDSVEKGQEKDKQETRKLAFGWCNHGHGEEEQCDKNTHHETVNPAKNGCPPNAEFGNSYLHLTSSVNA